MATPQPRLEPKTVPDGNEHVPGRLVAVARPEVRGKFLYEGNRKLYVRGVTYGTFRPDEEGCEYGDPLTVERDFQQMAAAGLNAVRTYTVPPRWLLARDPQRRLYEMGA